MSSPEKSSEEASKESSTDPLEQLRELSHRLSNSLEVIMQAQYLLQRSGESFPEVTKADVPKQEDQKWTAMIGNAAAEAAETNREIRNAVRRLSALQATEAHPLPPASRSGQKNRGSSR